MALFFFLSLQRPTCRMSMQPWYLRGSVSSKRVPITSNFQNFLNNVIKKNWTEQRCTPTFLEPTVQFGLLQLQSIETKYCLAFGLLQPFVLPSIYPDLTTITYNYVTGNAASASPSLLPNKHIYKVPKMCLYLGSRAFEVFSPLSSK
jgi:hypothetical protein